MVIMMLTNAGVIATVARLAVGQSYAPNGV